MIHGPQLLELAAVIDAERRSSALRPLSAGTPGRLRRTVGRALVGLGSRVEGTHRRGVTTRAISLR
jgi:hypothetical protein